MKDFSKYPKDMAIDDVKYVREDLVASPKKSGGEVIIRTYSDGVFICDKLDAPWEGEGKPVTMHNARQLYYWEGANTLNEIALSGLDRKKSRISKPVSERQTVPISIIPVSEGVDLSEVWNE